MHLSNQFRVKIHKYLEDFLGVSAMLHDIKLYIVCMTFLTTALDVFKKED